jgi:hypothetical protein
VLPSSRDLDVAARKLLCPEPAYSSRISTSEGPNRSAGLLLPNRQLSTLPVSKVVIPLPARSCHVGLAPITAIHNARRSSRKLTFVQVMVRKPAETGYDV